MCGRMIAAIRMRRKIIAARNFEVLLLGMFLDVGDCGVEKTAT